MVKKTELEVVYRTETKFSEIERAKRNRILADAIPAILGCPPGDYANPGSHFPIQGLGGTVSFDYTVTSITMVDPRLTDYVIDRLKARTTRRVKIATGEITREGAPCPVSLYYVSTVWNSEIDPAEANGERGHNKPRYYWDGAEGLPFNGFPSNRLI